MTYLSSTQIVTSGSAQTFADGSRAWAYGEQSIAGGHLQVVQSPSGHVAIVGMILTTGEVIACRSADSIGVREVRIALRAALDSRANITL